MKHFQPRDFGRNYEKPEVFRITIFLNDESVMIFFFQLQWAGNGVIDFVPDYVAEVLSPTYSLNKAKEWFQLEDSNRDGLVSRDELLTIAMNIGMTPKQAAETVDLFYMTGDINGDGKLNWKGIQSVHVFYENSLVCFCYVWKESENS